MSDSEEQKGRKKRTMRIREVAPTIPRSGASTPGRSKRAVSGKLPEALSTGLEPRVRKALDHRSRRVILRGLHVGKGSAVRTAEELLPGCSASHRHFHAGVLCECKLIERVDGVGDITPEPKFRSAVVGDSKVNLVLAATEQWDVEGADR